MQKRRLSALFLAALTVLLLYPNKKSAALQNGNASAASLALMEVSSGRLICAKNEHTSMEMASTTKILTAIVAIEYGNLNAMVAVDDSAIGVEGSSIYLAKGEKMQLSDLLYGLMLRSGNDAAVAIAIHISGSVEKFAALMNEKARAIGCTDSNFANPNGLHADGHYTSAQDLCMISAYAMRNPVFRTIVSTTYHTAESGDIQRTWKNKNKILWEFDGGCGVKTGYTKAAGKCLVFAAERDGVLLVGVVLNAPDMWNDAKSLLEYGFSVCTMVTLIGKDTPVTNIYVTGSEKKWLEVYTKGDILYPSLADIDEEITFTVDMPHQVTGPLYAGDCVGKLYAECNGQRIAQCDLVVREDAPLAAFPYYFYEVLHDFLCGA